MNIGVFANETKGLHLTDTGDESVQRTLEDSEEVLRVEKGNVLE